MAIARRSGRPRFTLLLLVLTSVSVVTLYYRGNAHGPIAEAQRLAQTAVSPVSGLVNDVAHPIESFFQGAIHYGSLEQANARLTQENQQLTGQLLSANRYAQEAAQLKQLNGLSYLQGTPNVVAEVIDFDPSNFDNAVEIDRGTSSGVAVGMPVVSGAGLIGRVTLASAHAATVELLTSPSSQVGVRFGNNQVAVANGQGEGKQLKVNYIPPGTDLKPGEPMLTSGLQGSIYPPDIPVGRVSQSRDDPGALQQSVSLKPLANFSKLDFVSVVEWNPQQ